MKLSSKYNQVNLIASLLVLCITGIAYYFTISYILNRQIDQELKLEEEEIRQFVKKHGELPDMLNFKDGKIAFEEISVQQTDRKFSDIDYLNAKEKEIEPGRSLRSTVTVKGKIYQMLIIKSKLETEDLIRMIFLITLGIIGLLLTVLTIVNRLLLKKLWAPFFKLLQQMKTFNITDQRELLVDTTRIDEFDELNQAALSMSSRVKKDYKSLKSFTENAAHEMMTPIAVLNGKLDSLLQTESITENQAGLMNDMYVAVSRLSRLNQSLLLLVKIENNLLQDDQENLDLRELLEQKIRQFRELLESKNIQLQANLQSKEIRMNKYLTDILLNNLLSNAWRHTSSGEEVKIILDQQKLTILNTGGTALDADKIFLRFHKNAASEGSGLGLAISKQICDSYGFKLEYTYQMPYHRFDVVFKASNQ
ncbi:MAG TPA: HAMP domain-containing sensor histidine kinase [Daejeonella sp.]|nr:HAMP domain-containing sensor histidine kinase [Daejeonella sp.]